MEFFKKKKESKDVKQEAKKEVNKQETLKNIEDLIKELKESEGDKRIELLTQLGSLYFEVNEIDKSIEYYETSLSESRNLGKAYTDLIKLYNIKRKEAALKKNDLEVQTYLNKTDDLMKLTKDTIRGRI